MKRFVIIFISLIVGYALYWCISDTVSGTFSEPTDGEVMTAKEFNDYVTQTTEMLKMNSGL